MPFPKQVTVSWTDPNPPGSVTEYRISRNQQPIAVVKAPPFSESISDPGTYQYDIVAANAQEAAPPSSGVLVLVPSLVAVQSVQITVA